MNFHQLDDYKQDTTRSDQKKTAVESDGIRGNPDIDRLVELFEQSGNDETPGELKVRLTEVSNTLKQISSFAEEFITSSGVVDFMWNAFLSSPDVCVAVVPGLCHLMSKSPVFVKMIVERNPYVICSWITSSSSDIRRAGFQVLNELMESQLACEWVLSSGVMDAIDQNARELIELFNSNPRLGEAPIAAYEDVLGILHALAFRMRSSLTPLIDFYVAILENTVNCEYSFRFNISILRLILLLSANGFMERLVSCENLIKPVLNLLFDDVARPCYPYLIEFESEIVRCAPQEVVENLVTNEALNKCVELFLGTTRDHQLLQACLRLFINVTVKSSSFVGLISDNERLWTSAIRIAVDGNVKLQEASLWFIWVVLGAASVSELEVLLPPVIDILPDSFLSDEVEFLSTVLDSLSNVLHIIELSDNLFQQFSNVFLSSLPDLIEFPDPTIAEKAHAILERYRS